MTENRYELDWEDDELCNVYDNFIESHISVEEVVDKLNGLHEENMNLRSKHTQLIILLKDIVNDLKRMDTKGYAEHIEKLQGVEFLSMEDSE